MQPDEELSALAHVFRILVERGRELRQKETATLETLAGDRTAETPASDHERGFIIPSSDFVPIISINSEPLQPNTGGCVSV